MKIGRVKVKNGVMKAVRMEMGNNMEEKEGL